MQFDLWLTSADLCMTFDPNNALHIYQGLFLPNLVAIGYFYKQFDLWLTPANPRITFDPCNALHIG